MENRETALKTTKKRLPQRPILGSLYGRFSYLYFDSVSSLFKDEVRSLKVYRFRCLQVEADLALWKAHAGGRGAGRGGRGRSRPQPSASPLPPPPPQPPPPPPPLPDLIKAVLAVPISIEGQMTEAEALSVLNVTGKRSKWLFMQVHPDINPDHKAEATAASARVNEAMDVRTSRHVTEV